MQTAKLGWRWGLGAAAAMIFLAVFPQLHFRIIRGNNWQGANAIMHPDEVVYSSVTAELIRGRPRRNDPYTGRQDRPDEPQRESSYSIQMVPAYLVALPARWLGLSATQAYIFFPAIFAFLSALSIYWFIGSLTRDKFLSAAAVWIVLGLGTLAAGQGMALHFLNLPYLIPQWLANLVPSPSLYHLPFLRFYQPAVAFPIFFLFCGLVWLALTSKGPRATQSRAILLSLGAGLTFGVLVFSYFYFWTAALAWLAVLAILWLAADHERRQSLVVFGIVGGCALAALIPYFLLLSHRAATTDSAFALMFSRLPDLFRLTELIGLLTLVGLALAVHKGKVRRRDPVLLFATSLALLPLVVFNQQIVTGRSLQPTHYQWFITNYTALTSVVLTASIWGRGRTNERRRVTSKRLAFVAVFAILFGGGEVWLTASQHLWHNTRIDEARPVMMRLAAIAQGADAADSIAAKPDLRTLPVTLVSDFVLADRLPTDAPQSVLWAPRMLIFPGVTDAENRERFFQQLYYSGYDERRFRAEMERADWNFYSGLFEYDRLSSALSGKTSRITSAEMEAQLQRYLSFARSFNRERAASPALSYLVVEAGNEPDYANLDRWYQREAREQIGKYLLFRLKLRD